MQAVEVRDLCISIITSNLLRANNVFQLLKLAKDLSLPSLEAKAVAAASAHFSHAVACDQEGFAALKADDLLSLIASDELQVRAPCLEAWDHMNAVETIFALTAARRAFALCAVLGVQVCMLVHDVTHRFSGIFSCSGFTHRPVTPCQVMERDVVMQVTSERQVFNAVVAWVEGDAEGRSAAFPRLLGEYFRSSSQHMHCHRFLHSCLCWNASLVHACCKQCPYTCVHAA